jgi:hypothetical protein
MTSLNEAILQEKSVVYIADLERLELKECGEYLDVYPRFDVRCLCTVHQQYSLEF